MEKIYDFILESIWKELIFGKTIENEATNLILFLIFSLFSLAIFHLQAYRGLILALFFTLWLIDRAIAQNYYNKPKNKFLVALKITDDKLESRQYLPKGQTIDLEFDRARIKEVAIFPRTLYSDGFQAEIKQCWQVLIFLQDDTDLLVSEETTPEKALTKAKQLANLLEIPIIFLDSEGNHPYATNELSPSTESNSNTIKVNSKSNKYHLYSQWRLRDSWQLLKQILVKSGFLIFVIIITNFMVRFGAIVDAFLTPFLSQQQTIIYWPSITQWFSPNFDLESYLEIGLAVGIIIFQGARMSRTQQIYLDQSLLKYYVGKQKQGQLKTPEIEAVILIPEPDLIVLVIAKNQALMIESLPNPDAHREIVAKLERTLNLPSVTQRG
ncbi:hypothetical protein [Halothece sp. PCC 7418]|uniref:hypothetical protein n=1 Tax=Halothece sp. (strain PCC 7418) TaxID=65093 RepID=UPI0012370B1C|nr:hypothetical protein [Halothece sp. PCC 7418]